MTEKVRTTTTMRTVVMPDGRKVRVPATRTERTYSIPFQRVEVQKPSRAVTMRAKAVKAAAAKLRPLLDDPLAADFDELRDAVHEMATAHMRYRMAVRGP